MKPTAFIWNDNPDTAKKWQLTAEKHCDDVKISSDTDPRTVVRDFLTSRAEFVVLDLLLDGKEATTMELGKTIGRAIREEDKLVPIIFVTRDAAALFGNAFETGEVQPCGLFDIGVMSAHPAFRDFALLGSRNQWHNTAPDFSLARLAVAALHAFRPVDGSALRHTANDLIVKIEQLPLYGSIEVWHQELNTVIHNLLIHVQCPQLAARFTEVMALFKASDPFYMATGTSRKHLSHNAQVFLLGVVVLFSAEPVGRSASESIAQLTTGTKHEDRLWHALAVWACIALTHDVAYLSEGLTKITEHLAGLAGYFETATGGSRDTLVAWSWPKTHHGVVGALLWQRGPGTSLPEAEPSARVPSGSPWNLTLAQTEEAYLRLIMQGIARHDAKARDDWTKLPGLGVNPGKVPLDPLHWTQFLAVLCDELQDWLRSPNTVRSHFRSFFLDTIRISNADAKVNLAMAFSGHNHPRWVREKVSAEQTKAISMRFGWMKNNLETNLDGGNRFHVTLEAQLPDVLETIPVVPIAF